MGNAGRVERTGQVARSKESEEAEKTSRSATQLWLHPSLVFSHERRSLLPRNELAIINFYPKLLAHFHLEPFLPLFPMYIECDCNTNIIGINAQRTREQIYRDDHSRITGNVRAGVDPGQFQNYMFKLRYVWLEDKFSSAHKRNDYSRFKRGSSARL